MKHIKLLKKIAKYIEASKMHSDALPGGLGDDKQPTDFPVEAVAAGMEVESEHTQDPKIAQEIVLDHLSEDEDYYKKLAELEKTASAANSPLAVIQKFKKLKHEDEMVDWDEAREIAHHIGNRK